MRDIWLTIILAEEVEKSAAESEPSKATEPEVPEESSANPPHCAEQEPLMEEQLEKASDSEKGVDGAIPAPEPERPEPCNEGKL